MPVNVQPAEAPVAAFRCFDAQEQAAVLPGWNQAYWQLSRGVFDGSVRAVSFEGTYVFIESANRALLQRGHLARGTLAVAVPLRLAGAARFCGEACSIDQAYVYSGRDGFEFCSPADHQVAGIALSPELVSALGGVNGPAGLLDRMGDRAQVRCADPQALESMRRLVSGLMEAFATTPVLVSNRHARAALKDAIVANVCELLEDAGAPAVVPLQLRARWALVARARELIEAAPHEPMNVARLCAALEVSRRTLQYCFQDVLGLSPIAYLRALRFNGARRSLLGGSAVTDAALDWGFWHLGQFAADYRQMFGELPSATAHRLRAGSVR
ncbi:MAG: helix-turn-helix domain-containing protein [Burkholderiales bacterium]|nr:helix-turn-helix domain-containing protein [Burkholderiales bacterium]